MSSSGKTSSAATKVLDDYLNCVVDPILRMTSGKKKVHPNRRKSHKDYVKTRMTAKAVKKFEQVKSEVKGAYIVKKERISENLDGLYVDHVPDEYFLISHGNVAVQDKISKEIVLVVNCLPFNKMTTDQYKDYEKVTTTLMTVKKGASFVACNKVQRTGQMFAVGWRSGYDKDLSLGRYVPHKRMQTIVSELENWKHHQILLSDISTLYSKRFCALAPSLFEDTRTEVLNAGVPTLSEIEFQSLEVEGNAFCSNLSFTMSDFSNAFHCDRDFNSYAFGMWAPTCSSSGYLRSRSNGFQSQGGHFLLGSYQVCVDLNSCDGIVEIIWRGRSDFHSTVPSVTSSNYTRIGTSLQVSDTLVGRMRTLCEMQKKGIDIRNQIRGVNDIVDLKMKNAK